MSTDILRQVLTNARQVTVAQAVSAFFRETGDLSPRTIEHYRYILDRFVSDIGNDRLLADLQEVDLRVWRAQVKDRKLSPYTFGSYLQVVKRFFTWLHEGGALTVNLAAFLELPHLPRGNRKGISDANAQAILNAARSNVRDYALLMFIDSTACRRGGAAGLLLSDINPDAPGDQARRARVREKGHPERTVLLTQAALDALRAWLAQRPPVEDDHVFLGRSPGRDWAPLAPESIRAMINRYRDRLGLKGPVSPHQWRHRRSRQLIRAGMSMKAVSQLNGHSVAVCERYYSDLDENALLEEFDRHAR